METSRGDWKLLLSFRLPFAADGGKESKPLPASDSNTVNKGKKQQEGNLDQCKPEAAPIYVSQVPEQTLDDIRADNWFKKMNPRFLQILRACTHMCICSTASS